MLNNINYSVEWIPNNFNYSVYDSQLRHVRRKQWRLWRCILPQILAQVCILRQATLTSIITLARLSLALILLPRSNQKGGTSLVSRQQATMAPMVMVRLLELVQCEMVTWVLTQILAQVRILPQATLNLLLHLQDFHWPLFRCPVQIKKGEHHWFQDDRQQWLRW